MRDSRKCDKSSSLVTLAIFEEKGKKQGEWVGKTQKLHSLSTQFPLYFIQDETMSPLSNQPLGVRVFAQ